MDKREKWVKRYNTNLNKLLDILSELEEDSLGLNINAFANMSMNRINRFKDPEQRFYEELK